MVPADSVSLLLPPPSFPSLVSSPKQSPLCPLVWASQTQTFPLRKCSRSLSLPDCWLSLKRYALSFCSSHGECQRGEQATALSLSHFWRGEGCGCGLAHTFPTPGETGHCLHCHSEAMKMTHTCTSQPHWNTVLLCRETNISSPKVTKMQLSSVLGPQPECFEFSQAGVSWPDLNPPRNSRISN